MKKTVIASLFCCGLLVYCAGCAPLIIGAAAGGLGAYAISKDTIQGETDKSYSAIWDAALRVSRIRGTIKKQDSTHGMIEFEEGSAYIWIRVVKLTQATTRLKISSRKYHLPDIALAQDVFVKIMDEAR